MRLTFFFFVRIDLFYLRQTDSSSILLDVFWLLNFFLTISIFVLFRYFLNRCMIFHEIKKKFLTIRHVTKSKNIICFAILSSIDKVERTTLEIARFSHIYSTFTFLEITSRNRQSHSRRTPAIFSASTLFSIPGKGNDLSIVIHLSSFFFPTNLFIISDKIENFLIFL